MWPSDDGAAGTSRLMETDGRTRGRPRLSPDKVNGGAVGGEEGWLRESRFSFSLFDFSAHQPGLVSTVSGS